MSDSGKLSVAWLYDDTLDTNDGVAQYVKTLGAWMSDQGHKVSYLVGESKTEHWHGGSVYSLSKNLGVRWNGNRLSVPLKPKLNVIKELLDKQNFDVVHVMAPYSPLMAQQVIKRLPSTSTVIATWHIYPSDSKTVIGAKLIKPMYRQSLKRFDAFVSVSPAAQEYAKKAFGCESDIIPNVIDLKRYAHAQKPGSKKPRIVFLGRLVKRKGADRLLEAIHHLHQNIGYNDFEVLIAGDGPERRTLEKKARTLNLEKHLTFAGYIEEAKKPQLLASADIACFPSLYGESFGIVLLEAMAAGAGVIIAGDNPGYRSVLAAQPKLLVDVQKDGLALAEQLHYWLTNKSAAADIHRWQISEVTKYDVERVGPQLIKLYRQRISSHN